MIGQTLHDRCTFTARLISNGSLRETDTCPTAGVDKQGATESISHPFETRAAFFMTEGRT